MSFEIPQVFISSTSEFRDERKHLANELGGLQFAPFIYEEEAASGVSPEKHCRKMLEASEVVVLILGAKYGSAFPGGQVSIVEWEYQTALETEKALKPYVKQFPPEVPVEPPQAEFVRRVTDFRTGSWCRMFRAMDELVQYVRDDIQRWRLDCWKLLRDTEPRRRRWQDNLILIVALIVAMLTIGGVAGPVLLGVKVGFEKLTLIFLAGVSILLVLGFFLRSKIL